jgi:tetratricopeptide (TPR) repeat protein
MVRLGFSLALYVFWSAFALTVTIASPSFAEQPQRPPILISGIQEPDEMRVAPVSLGSPDLTAPERELAEATKNFTKMDDPNALLALNQILSKYPEFADGYLFRLGLLCDRNDRQAATSDINNAIKYAASSRIKQPLALLSMRAKLTFANGSYAGVMNFLEEAIRSDLGHASDFTNTGAAKPEKTASVCVWTSSDMDALTQRFPADYRSYMYRGLYFSKFAPIDDDSIEPAMESFDKAIQLSPKSPLPQLFKTELLGNFLVFQKRLAKLGWNDDSRDKLDGELVREYSKALLLDPNLLLALKGRALAYHHLKQYRQAIADYDHILSIDIHDATSIHDRGLAKMFLGEPYEAISDFGSYIELKKVPGSPLEGQYDAAHGYESRGDAYIKTRQWDRAISDYTKAISIQVGSSLLLMNVSQFHAIYPEYRMVSDDILARKLQQTFYPNFKYDDFSKDFFERRPMPSTVIPDLYMKRADAYLGEGNWHQASVEFRRAANGFPSYADALDRWREIAPMGRQRMYVDLKTFDDAKHQSVKVWVKQFQGPGEPNTIGYTLQQFELNCMGGELRPISFANYNASGELTRSGQGGRWSSPVPETLGEAVYSGACRPN